MTLLHNCGCQDCVQGFLLHACNIVRMLPILNQWLSHDSDIAQKSNQHRCPRVMSSAGIKRDQHVSVLGAESNCKAPKQIHLYKNISCAALNYSFLQALIKTKRLPERASCRLQVAINDLRIAEDDPNIRRLFQDSRHKLDL